MIKPLLAQYDLHHRLYNNVLDGFTDEESNQRLHQNKNINHVKYLAGHLLNSQYGLAVLAGLKVNMKWDEYFAVMGKSKAKDDFPYPTLAEIVQEWNHLHLDLRDALSALNDYDLSSVPPKPFDEVAETKSDLWAFISHHQAYHIGQIGILRRGFGKKPMSYQ